MPIEFDAVVSTSALTSDHTIAFAAGASTGSVLYIMIANKGPGGWTVTYDGSTVGVEQLYAVSLHPNSVEVLYKINPSSDSKNIQAVLTADTLRETAISVISYLGVDTDGPHGTHDDSGPSSGPITLTLETETGGYNVMWGSYSSTGGGWDGVFSAPVVERYSLATGEMSVTIGDDSAPASTSVEYTFTQDTDYGAIRAGGWPLVPASVGPVDYPVAVAGTFTPAGTVIKGPGVYQAGTVTPAGVAIKGISKSGTGGTVTPTGAYIRGAGKPVGGTVTPAGVLARVVAWYRSLAGTVTPAGTVIKGAGKALTGVWGEWLDGIWGGTLIAGITGALIKGPGKVLAGTLTPAGRLLQRIANFFRIWFDGSPETVARIDITATADIQVDDSPETTVILER